MKLQVFALLLFATAATACASAGVDMLDASTASIMMPNVQLSDSASIRRIAAKTTREHGFRYYTIVSMQDATRVRQVVVPGQTLQTGGPTGMSSMGGMSGMGTPGLDAGAAAPSSTVTTPSTTRTVVEPGVRIVIKMFKDGEIDPKQAGVFDASAL